MAKNARHFQKNRPSKKARTEPVYEDKQENPMTNADYEEFYKNVGIVPDDEWENFLKTFRTPLPSAFRIHESSPFADNLKRTLDEEIIASYESSMGAEAAKTMLRKIEWYPGGYGYVTDLSGHNLRKEGPLKKFMVTHNDQGNISRQEEVSMVPVYFLGLDKHHNVLDMCAAPGSKTAQVLDILTASTSKSTPETQQPDSDGFVVANDADTNRAFMLVHQVKRFQSPNVMVTNYDATQYPRLLGKYGDQVTEMEFDRVLCDVPCSGDGTLRKAPELWKRWSLVWALKYHQIQIPIAMRGLELLKVGGMMVYSTCSLNPMEDESVVAELLRRSGGAVEVVDVSHLHPNLRRRPGMLTWKVMDWGQGKNWVSTHDELPPRRQEKVPKTLFSNGEEEGRKMGLDKTFRILPHLQNTGGFYVAVLRKIAPLPVQPPSASEASVSESTPAPADGACETSAPATTTESDAVSANPEGAESGKGEGRRPQKGKGKGKDGKDGAPPRGNKDNQMRRKNAKDEVFIRFDTNVEEIELTSQFWGLPSHFPVSQLYVRGNESSQRVYLVSPRIKAILDADPTSELKIVHTGVKVVEKNKENGKYNQLAERVPFRITQEGMGLTLPYLLSKDNKPMSDAVILTNLESWLQLLKDSEATLNFDRITDPVMKQAALKLDIGPLVLVLPPDEAAQSINHSKCAYGLAAFRGRSTVKLFVSKEELESLRLQFIPDYISTLPVENISDNISSMAVSNENATTQEPQDGSEENAGVDDDTRINDDAAPVSENADE
eukprot:TRINITY_DN16011_c0_g1::TRINITY_DN16011_c0_g1_i1::g.3717::m.3717 TRINITY_DN16011_c0_g1::TRINITY_DN16011_c0_g1_i1::g.3717  ORF type:complete len:790 (+),score=214.91,sp/Q28E61/NSUN2_XENTR/35.12/5e-127,Nol1_Nop2_Fmu/PF01189.12/1.1e-13,Nol1_Nop2_Fmu/PF01189.12/3e-15,Nol1_Nop2_Fmu/PF01189.12/18,Cas_Cmr5/PF09701.5/1.2e-06,FtsJ/PF01728.14/0.0058 TRINITY_DN16011_c0_g1_i1:41-2371(+)